LFFGYAGFQIIVQMIQGVAVVHVALGSGEGLGVLFGDIDSRLGRFFRKLPMPDESAMSNQMNLVSQEGSRELAYESGC